MIRGLYETHVHTTDLERSMKFYGEVMGLKLGYFEEKRRAAFYWIHKSDQPSVHCWMPAVSVYFSDPDGNSLEFIALLPDPPRPELGIVPWDEWERLNGRG